MDIHSFKWFGRLWAELDWVSVVCLGYRLKPGHPSILCSVWRSPVQGFSTVEVFLQNTQSSLVLHVYPECVILTAIAQGGFLRQTRLWFTITLNSQSWCRDERESWGEKPEQKLMWCLWEEILLGLLGPNPYLITVYGHRRVREHLLSAGLYILPSFLVLSSLTCHTERG